MTAKQVCHLTWIGVVEKENLPVTLFYFIILILYALLLFSYMFLHLQQAVWLLVIFDTKRSMSKAHTLMNLSNIKYITHFSFYPDGAFWCPPYVLHVIRLSDVPDHVIIYQPVIFCTGDGDVPKSATCLYCITPLMVYNQIYMITY